VAVDDVAKVIYGAEVKSSIKGSFPDPDTLNLSAKFDAWIRNAAAGKLNGQDLDPNTIKFAEELVLKLKDGYTIKPFMVKVEVPMPGTTGAAKATIVPVK
jgi:filamentous hemagglutinin